MYATVHHNTAAQNAGVGPAWHRTPASPGRLNLINTMLTERAGVISDDVANRLRERIAARNIDTGTAIATIEWLKRQAPKGGGNNGQPARRATVTITEAGFYRNAEGAVFKVQESKTNPGRFYAKAVTAHGWDYDLAKGVVYHLTSDMLMTVEDVMAFGVESEICAICSTHLEDPVSKFIGIGPTCGPKFMGKDAYNAAKKVAKADPKVAEQLAAIKAAKDAAARNAEVVTPVQPDEVWEDKGVVLSGQVDESDRFDDGYWDRQVQLRERAEDERVAAYKMARDGV
jgi:hypothetical protein